MKLQQNTLFAFACRWFSFQLNGTENARRGKYNTNVFFGRGKRDKGRKFYKFPKLFWSPWRNSLETIAHFKAGGRQMALKRRGLRDEGGGAIYFMRFYIAASFDTYRAGPLGLFDPVVDHGVGNGKYTIFVKFGRWQFLI